jgi:acid phosphatase
VRRSTVRILPLVLVAVAATVAVVAVKGTARAADLPRPDHVVVVVMENHSYSSVIGSTSAPYINALAAQGASFTNYRAISHPSEPNYLALFSGSTQGVGDDSCPHTFSAANLGSQLIDAGLTFAGYSESMPSGGYTGCEDGDYVRRHNPWVNFTNVPAAANRTFDAFPSDYTMLPTVAFVVPNLADDMHDGSVAQGDTWLRDNLDGYAQWARSHNSELIVTWDEDDDTAGNQIPTIVVGAHVTAGRYDEAANHYNLLRTVEAFHGLPAVGAAADATPITDIFDPAPTADPGSAAARYGWTNLVYRDDFNGSALGPGWGVYDSAGNNGNGIRSPAQISVANGVMTTTGAADGTTAGISARQSQKYGRWEVRARFPAGCGCYHPILILWPDADNWPAAGEIDYAEVFDAGRRTLHFFLHYSADNRQLFASVPVDMTQWHDYAVEWTADHITGYLDGEPFFHTDRQDVQPPGPMAQTIQLDWFPGDNAGTGASLEVDWATMYGL